MPACLALEPDSPQTIDQATQRRLMQFDGVHGTELVTAIAADALRKVHVGSTVDDRNRLHGAVLHTNATASARRTGRGAGQHKPVEPIAQEAGSPAHTPNTSTGLPEAV